MAFEMMQRSPRPFRFLASSSAEPADASGPPELAVNSSVGAPSPALTESPRLPKRARIGAAHRAAAPQPPASEDETDTEPCIAFEGEDGLDVSFPLKAVERSFRCPLCSGYFRDAVTIKECLHTFCRWCLYNYVERGGAEEVCCPFCEKNMQLIPPHRDGAGKDCRHYMPRVTAACVAGACIQTGGSSSSSGAATAAAAANAAVLFDRTMQNIVDKLFPHFAEQERLEEEELQRYMQQHRHKPLPPEYVTQGLSSVGLPYRREAGAQRRARLEARAAAEEALGPPPVEPPLPQQQLQQQQHEEAAVAVSKGASQKEKPEAGRSGGRRGAVQQLQQQQLLQHQHLDEFVDHLLGATTCFDEQLTTAIALLPDTYQSQLMIARLKHQLTQVKVTPQGTTIACRSPPEYRGLLALPLELPRLERPYLRVPSRMSVQLVLRYLASQLRPLLFPQGDALLCPAQGEQPGCCSSEEPIDLEMALELTLEGRVLGRSHSIDFVRKAQRLNCAGKCILLQYRYTAQTESRVVSHHLAHERPLNDPSKGPDGAAAGPESLW